MSATTNAKQEALANVRSALIQRADLIRGYARELGGIAADLVDPRLAGPDAVPASERLTWAK